MSNQTDQILTKLREIKERADKAEKAPWHYVHGYGFSFHPSGDGPPTDSTRFVCAARTAVPTLVKIAETAIPSLVMAHDSMDNNFECIPSDPCCACIAIAAILALLENT